MKFIKKDPIYVCIILVLIFIIFFLCKPDINSSKKAQLNIAEKQVINQVEKMENSSISGNINIVNNTSKSEHDRYMDTSEFGNLSYEETIYNLKKIESEFYSKLSHSYKMYIKHPNVEQDCKIEELFAYEEKFSSYCSTLAASKLNSNVVRMKCRKEVLLDFNLQKCSY